MITNKIEISIIVAVYNVEKYLDKCIQSILNQTFKDFELILVNDGSIDKSGEICDNYSRKDIRVKVIHKSNGGQASARNCALEIAKGNYIGFVDSDDWIEPNMFELLYNSCKENSSDISIIGLREVSYDKTYLFEYIPENISLSEILKRAYPVNKLFKKELFTSTSLKFVSGKYYEDLELIPKLIVKSKKISVVKQIGYNYFQRNDSTTHVKDKKILDLLWAYCEIKRYLIDQNMFFKYEDEFYKALIYLQKFYANILYDYSIKFLIENYKKILSYFNKLLKVNKVSILKFIIIYIKKMFRRKIANVIRYFIK